MNSLLFDLASFASLLIGIIYFSISIQRLRTEIENEKKIIQRIKKANLNQKYAKAALQKKLTDKGLDDVKKVVRETIKTLRPEDRNRVLRSINQPSLEGQKSYATKLILSAEKEVKK